MYLVVPLKRPKRNILHSSRDPVRRPRRKLLYIFPLPRAAPDRLSCRNITPPLSPRDISRTANFSRTVSLRASLSIILPSVPDDRSL